MAEELGIPAGQRSESPIKHGLITFIAFLIFGVVPLISCAPFPATLVFLIKAKMLSSFCSGFATTSTFAPRHSACLRP